MMAIRTFRSIPVLIAMLLCLCAFASVASAQSTGTRLNAIFPPGGKAGSTVDVTLNGADLDGVTAIHFSNPGITAKANEGSDGDADRKFIVTIAADVPPGNYEARVSGRDGVSNPRGFVVGNLHEIIAAGPSKGDKSPVLLPLDTIANGHVAANAFDEYSIELKQGQRVYIECQVREIDSRLIPIMTLSAPGGNEVARARRGDSIDFTSPADGAYILRLHDLLYKGGVDYFYRLCASTAPHLDAIYPPVGTPGEKSKFTLLGRNLPGGTASAFRGSDGRQLEKLEVEIEIPAGASAPPKADTLSLLGAVGAGIDAIAYRLKSDRGISNPLLIGFARAPLVLEQEPNNSADKSQKLTAPCEVVGRFYPRGDRDIYTFDADKGSVYWIEILSTRLGLHTSPELLVQTVGKTDKGEEKLNDVQDIGGPDMQPMGKRGGGAAAAFPATTRDIEYRLESKEAATYRLTVRDLFDQTEDNASLVYCMIIHKQSPDFHLVATTAPLPAKDGNNTPQDPNIIPPFLRKGGTTAIRVNVLRQEGFDDEVHVEAQGLPPGVRCAPTVVPAGENVTTLLLMADDSVQDWSGDLKIVGKAKVGDEEKSRDARVGAITWSAVNPNDNNGERAHSRLSCDMPLVVSADESEALTIDVPETTFESKPDGKIHLNVRVKRHAEMKQPLKFRVEGLPRANNNNGKNEFTLGPDADSGGLDLDLGPQRLGPGVYTIYVQAQTQLKFDRKKNGSEKGEKGDAAKKRAAVEAQAVFYSGPITVKILPK